MISRTAEYAVRAALWLANRPGRPAPVQQIAEETAVPANYLAKVLQSLGRAGLVRAQPGPGGGFELNADPATISLLAVLAAVDPFQRIRTCPLKRPEHRDGLCPLHARLDSALEHIERALGACSLAQLLEESGDSGLFCKLNPPGGDGAGELPAGPRTVPPQPSDHPGTANGRPTPTRFPRKGKLR